MKMNGPGKYDNLCGFVLEGTQAVGVLLVVVEGNQGTGVSFKMLDPDLMRVMPTMLEKLAAEMRADAQAGSH